MQGILFTKGQTELVKYPMGKDDKTYHIPDGVSSIKEYSFKGNLYLEEISIPNTIGSIGNNAFADCEQLSRVVLPDGLKEIESFLLSNCRNITEITIPENVRIIGTWAFWNCCSLSNINCKVSDISSVKPYAYGANGALDAFEGISKNCTWHVVEGTKDDYLAQPWWVSTWSIFDDLHDNIENATIVDECEILWNDGILKIQSNCTGIIRIYSINGSQLHRINVQKGMTYQVRLPSGIYILNNKKIFLK